MGDRDEIERFMSLMDKAKEKNMKEKVKICWVNGKVQYSRVTQQEERAVSQTGPGPDRETSQTLIKLLRQDSQGHSKEELLHRRKEEYRERMMCGEATEHSQPRRKRKFVDR